MFTYRDYYELITKVLSNKEMNLFLRHDIDISTAKALELAKRESNIKCGPTTYFIHTCSEMRESHHHGQVSLVMC